MWERSRKEREGHPQPSRDMRRFRSRSHQPSLIEPRDHQDRVLTSPQSQSSSLQPAQAPVSSALSGHRWLGHPGDSDAAGQVGPENVRF